MSLNQPWPDTQQRRQWIFKEPTGSGNYIHWKAPNYGTMADLFICGPGAGAGGRNAGTGAGGGGGGSGAITRVIIPLLYIPTLYISIGTGGAGGASGSNGTSGGSTAVARHPNFSAWTAAGGTFGQGASGSLGGAGGVAMSLAPLRDGTTASLCQTDLGIVQAWPGWKGGLGSTTTSAAITTTGNNLGGGIVSGGGGGGVSGVGGFTSLGPYADLTSLGADGYSIFPPQGLFFTGGVGNTGSGKGGRGGPGCGGGGGGGSGGAGGDGGHGFVIITVF